MAVVLKVFGGAVHGWRLRVGYIRRWAADYGGKRRPGERKLAGQVGSVSRYMAQLCAGVAEDLISTGSAARKARESLVERRSTARGRNGSVAIAWGEFRAGSADRRRSSEVVKSSWRRSNCAGAWAHSGRWMVWSLGGACVWSPLRISEGRRVEGRWGAMELARPAAAERLDGLQSTSAGRRLRAPVAL